MHPADPHCLCPPLPSSHVNSSSKTTFAQTGSFMRRPRNPSESELHTL